MLAFQIVKIFIAVLLMLCIIAQSATDEKVFDRPWFRHKWRGNRTTPIIEDTTAAGETTTTTASGETTTTTTAASASTNSTTETPCLTDLCKRGLKANKGLFVINFFKK
ncbi:uncharacterized protein LOC129916317 [Episyrphus balteatus]|uniref:uncharacterized protein LOC129916317 n=1 Tax=Episyrphus balteatus TaxID=286459 RepID=UPI002484F1D0|nr:uncharacterized protein LOC129916317 [Episyrphus balteatus]